MILTLNIKECAALTIHMSIMRKSIRNILKKKYPKEKGELLESFDYIHQEAQKGLEASARSVTHYTINANIRDIKLLTEFLNVYTNKLNELDMKLPEEDKEQIEVLNKLFKKCTKMIQETSN